MAACGEPPQAAGVSWGQRGLQRPAGADAPDEVLPGPVAAPATCTEGSEPRRGPRSPP